MSAEKNKEKDIEDRKVKRVKIQGTQQSEMIEQRNTKSLPIDFEQPPINDAGMMPGMMPGLPV
jgi:hypothetical protein